MWQREFRKGKRLRTRKVGSRDIKMRRQIFTLKRFDVLGAKLWKTVGLGQGLIEHVCNVQGYVLTRGIPGMKRHKEVPGIVGNDEGSTVRAGSNTAAGGDVERPELRVLLEDSPMTAARDSMEGNEEFSGHLLKVINDKFPPEAPPEHKEHAKRAKASPRASTPRSGKKRKA